MNGNDEIRMRTEDDLRAALTTLERHAPTVESVLRPIHQPSRRTRSARWLTRPRLTAAAATVTAAAAALAVVAVQSGGQAGPRQGVSQAYLAAWSVQHPSGGLIKIEIRQLKNAAGLQAALRADGVPANVTFPRHPFEGTTSSTAIPRQCQPPKLSDEANAKLQAKIMPPAKLGPSGKNAVVLIIRPSAIPSGLGLFIKAFATSPGSSSTWLSLQTDLVQASAQCTG